MKEIVVTTLQYYQWLNSDNRQRYHGNGISLIEFPDLYLLFIANNFDVSKYSLEIIDHSKGLHDHGRYKLTQL